MADVRNPALISIPLDESNLAHDLLVLRATAAEWLIRGEGSIAVDVSSLRRLSSETIAALLWTRRKCNGQGIGFTVHGATGNVAQALTRCGLGEAIGAGGR